MKAWKTVSWENCDECGDEIECLTDCEEGGLEQFFYDGDECRCVACGLKGTMSADGEKAWVSYG